MDVESRVYLSRTVLPFDVVTLQQLADRSKIANSRAGVTGFLTHRDGSFVQYLEGTPTALDNLLVKIVADRRHEVIRLERLGRGPRRFVDWGMEVLDPLWMPTASAHDTLQELLGIAWSDSARMSLLGEVRRSVERIATEYV